jgi:putative hydrolase of the HAD superfamily
MLGLKAVIFDFDGLLMDTESTSVLSWEREWACWGLALDRESFFAPHGGDVTEERHQQLAQTVGASFDSALSTARRRSDRDSMNAKLPLAAGMREWLECLAELDLRAAVASSSPRDWVERHLRQVDAMGYFDAFAYGDEVPDHKPAPDVYHLCLARLGVEPDEAVAVEDTPHGVTAAQTAGLACIAIPNSHVARNKLQHADLVLSSAAQLPLEQALHRAITHALTTERPPSRAP